MEILMLILSVVLAYLIGSIPTSVWIGKIFYKVDVREMGSGNAGATNTIRLLGWKAGVPVLVFDVFKGWLAVYISQYLLPESIPEVTNVYYRIIIAVAAVLGHVFPIYAGFRGGKGIATLLGIGIALYPESILIVLAIFAGVLIFTGYVSLSSIIASICFPFIVVFFSDENHLALNLLAVFVAVFVPLTHHKNIKRLIQGKENRFSILKKIHKSKNG